MDSEISIAFFLLIYSQVVISEKSTTLKLIHRYKPLKVKIGDNLVEIELLLFIANFA